MMRSTVYIVQGDYKYPESPVEPNNDVKRGLEKLFRLWGMPEANPFSQLINEGETVVLKPNWVLDDHQSSDSLDSLVTHSSLIAQVIDYVAAAMKGRGRIIVGDAPLQTCEFKGLLNKTGMDQVKAHFVQKYPDLELIVEDWRLTFATSGNALKGERHCQVTRPSVDGEVEKTHEIVNLAHNSFLEDISDYSERFRVTCYRHSLMKQHHLPGTHEYVVTRRIREANLVINLPKMKTHIKAGITGALKNLVGINGHKEYLPHHIYGPYFSGGDNYCLANRLWNCYERFYDYYWEHYALFGLVSQKLYGRVLGLLWKISRIPWAPEINAGSWCGNETIWRTTLDLNHLMYFMLNTDKRVITIVDGIIAGEGEGPLDPTPKRVGLLIGGENPAYIDAVIARMIGYNISRVPTVYNAIFHRKSKFSAEFFEDLDIRYCKGGGESKKITFDSLPNLNFVLPAQWARAKLGTSIKE